MIMALKRTGYLFACFLYIPISSLFTGLWLTMGIPIIYGCYICMPIEYKITGKLDKTSEMIDYIWYILPEKYDKISKHFFETIYPENENDIKSE